VTRFLAGLVSGNLRPTGLSAAEDVRGIGFEIILVLASILGLIAGTFPKMLKSNQWIIGDNGHTV
jgi:hypothetical protein